MIKPTRDPVGPLFTDRRGDLVRYLTSHLANAEDARDLAQEAYLRLLRLKKSDLIRNPEAYLFRIAANLLHEHWLKGQRLPADKNGEIDLNTLPALDESVEEQIGQREAISELERALRALPLMHQRVVIMHRRDGMTYREIALELGISRNMVKKHLAKGLARCREQLRHYRYE